ncbi:MAG: hypothetical protein SGI77_16145 [Pirellulaceae bacterium]|nr:hypothetical protein [Pirellulaceae bacterium]
MATFLTTTKSFSIVAVFILSSQVIASDEFQWSGPGYVLLKNGNVLSASRIETQDKLVAVELDKTGQVRIPNKDIVVIGRNPLELYRYQVSKTAKWGAGEHWNLAKWCLRQGLFEQAHEHYEQLKKESGDHAKFKQLDAEMKQALLRDPVMKSALAAAFPTRIVSTAFHITEKQQVGKIASSAAEATPLNVSPSAKTKALPLEKDSKRYSQDYFRSQLQPLLAMRCGQAGCHGAFGKTEYHIAKSGSLHGQPAADISYASARSNMDNEILEATRLWLKATTAHGPQSVPSLSIQTESERELLDRMRIWHQGLYRTTTPSLMPKATANSQPKPDNAIPALTNQTRSTPALELGDDLLELEREIAKLEVKERERKSANRHDPEAFNRRFGQPNP